MRKLFIFLSVFFLGFITTNVVTAQCNPDTINCIDVDDPGEICPDTLVEGMVNVPYNEVVTVIPPDSYNYNGSPVDLSHIQIIDISNIPPGLSYVSNATDDIFEVGTYYCILISGTPTTEGTFQLEIEAKPWVQNTPMPLTVTDDSSLFIVIKPYVNSITDLPAPAFSVKAAFPNPFDRASEIECTLPYSGKTRLSVFDELGRDLYQEEKILSRGSHTFIISGDNLQPGIYFYSIYFDGEIKSGILMKH